MRAFLDDVRTVTDRQAKWALLLLVPLSITAAVFELIGIVLVVPLLSVLSDVGGTGTSIVNWIGDRLGTDDRTTLGTILAIAVLVAFLLKTVITLGIKWWSFGALAHSEARTTTRLFDSYLFAPYEFHLQRNSSEAIRNLTDSVPTAYSQALVGLVGLVSESALVIGIAALVILAAPIAALGLAAYFAVVGVVYARVVLRRSARLGVRAQEMSQEGYTVMGQSFGAIKQVIVANKQPVFAERFLVNRERVASVRQRIQFVAELPRLFLELAFVAGVVVLTLAILRMENSERALGILVLFFAAGLRLLPALNRLFNSVTAVRVGRAALSITADITRDLRAATWERAPTTDLVDLHGAIRLDGITFGYPSRAQPALRDVSLEIQPGSTIGIVGPSGAGKSTLVDLVLALYRPQSGRLTVGDVDVFDHVEAWRNRVGLVPQDVYLLDTSLRENIAFGERPEEIDDDKVAEVIQQAELDDFVAGLPDGALTTMGERGVRVSGGQRQRIGIARALYRDPELLVLDEATSALDTLTEQRITKTIEALHGQLTILMVAHRLSTVRRCDRIVFLVDGRVQAVGPFDDLVAGEPQFAHLVKQSELGHTTSEAG